MTKEARQPGKSSREMNVKTYVDFYEAPTPERISELAETLSKDVHFIDPFNNVKGQDKVIAILEKMFVDVQNPRFDILDIIWSDQICFLRWDFFCHQKMIGNWSFRGMSELHFDEEGKISAHYDYWDSGLHFYAKLPVIGAIIRTIIKRASIT